MSRGWNTVLTIALCLLLTIGTRAQDNEDDEENYSYNEIDLIPTYRSGIEKVLQGLLKILSGGSSSSSSSSGSSSGGLDDFLGKIIPKPIKNIIAPLENITVATFGDILNLFEENFHAIYPGTLWCGAGNIASSEEDVGLFKGTDACCRAHDNCPININAGNTYGDLLNNGIFTRSACFCDNEFYHCLKNVSSIVSANIGTTYFNILRPQCFSYDYPIVSCAKQGSNRIVEKKCLEYNLDYSENKTLEWFDSPDY